MSVSFYSALYECEVENKAKERPQRTYQEIGTALAWTTIPTSNAATAERQRRTVVESFIMRLGEGDIEALVGVLKKSIAAKDLCSTARLVALMRGEWVCEGRVCSAVCSVERRLASAVQLLRGDDDASPADAQSAERSRWAEAPDRFAAAASTAVWATCVLALWTARVADRPSKPSETLTTDVRRVTQSFLGSLETTVNAAITLPFLLRDAPATNGSPFRHQLASAIVAWATSHAARARSIARSIENALLSLCLSRGGGDDDTIAAVGSFLPNLGASRGASGLETIAGTPAGQAAAASNSSNTTDSQRYRQALLRALTVAADATLSTMLSLPLPHAHATLGAQLTEPLAEIEQLDEEQPAQAMRARGRLFDRLLCLLAAGCGAGLDNRGGEGQRDRDGSATVRLPLKPMFELMLRVVNIDIAGETKRAAADRRAGANNEAARLLLVLPTLVAAVVHWLCRVTQSLTVSLAPAAPIVGPLCLRLAALTRSPKSPLRPLRPLVMTTLGSLAESTRCYLESDRLAVPLLQAECLPSIHQVWHNSTSNPALFALSTMVATGQSSTLSLLDEYVDDAARMEMEVADLVAATECAAAFLDAGGVSFALTSEGAATRLALEETVATVWRGVHETRWQTVPPPSTSSSAPFHLFTSSPPARLSLLRLTTSLIVTPPPNGTQSQLIPLAAKQLADMASNDACPRVRSASLALQRLTTSLCQPRLPAFVSQPVAATPPLGSTPFMGTLPEIVREREAAREDRATHAEPMEGTGGGAVAAAAALREAEAAVELGKRALAAERESQIEGVKRVRVEAAPKAAAVPTPVGHAPSKDGERESESESESDDSVDVVVAPPDEE
mmetsp:Transcript_16713/g.52234  ORF Transcript_16713/g.52234 Transcript_16713/m.52234 type:complete len:848 (-) Transcript_16713:94-2637(-)